MKKRIALLVVVLMVVSTGCSNGNMPAPDPFFGKMTIAPPSTTMGMARSNETPYTPQPVVATPVSPNHTSSDQPWSSPLPPNFTPGSTTSSNSIAGATPSGRTIHLSPNTIEDSLRSPNYTSSSDIPSPAWSTRPATVAPRTITPPQNLQAINGRPVREQSDISYRSADGSIPQYNDPRSSFGQVPRARFRNASRSSTAPPWSPSQTSTGGNSERVAAPGFGEVQTTITPGTVASDAALEELLPPIRGYDTSRQTAADTSTRKRVARSAMTCRSENHSTSALVSSRSIDTRSRPYRFVNLADLPDASRMASRPSRSTGGVKRLHYEIPVDDRSGSSSTGQKDASVQPATFTPTVRYSHNDNYTTLCGELEYSQIDRHWKLRYIPFDDEESDDYGGSVILRETTKLSGFERGDFVEVRGRLLGGPEGDVAYKRSYEVQDIEPIH